MKMAPSAERIQCTSIMPGFQRPRTISEGVYGHLRDELFSGRLQPGQWLREQEVAEELRVSRTPVREAMRRLALEGLLLISANRGARVRPITLEDTVAVYEVRERLEGMAAALAARHADRCGVEALLARLQAMAALARDDYFAHVQADNDLHLYLAKLSGNPVLAEFVQRLNERVTPAKVVTRDLNATPEVRAQHRAIVEAVASGDPAAAESAMRDHVRGNLAVLRVRLTADVGGLKTPEVSQAAAPREHPETRRGA